MLVTGYVRDNKNKEERREQLKWWAVEYCKLNGYLVISREFPFYFAAIIFPKDVEEIVKHLMDDSTNEERLLYLKVLKVVQLLKGIVKTYSEVRLKKISYIYEIKLLLDNFLSLVKDGFITLSGLVNSDSELDRKYIKSIVESFQWLIDTRTLSPK